MRAPKPIALLYFSLLLRSSYLLHASDGVILHTWNSSQRCSALTSGLAIPQDHLPAYLIAETPRTYLVVAKQFPSPMSSQKVLVIDKSTHQVIGSMRITIEGKRAHLPLRFNVENQASGIGTEAKYALLRYAFEKLGAEDVHDAINFSNKASIRLHEKLGFKLLSGQLILHFGLTKQDFKKARGRFQRTGTVSYRPRVKTEIVESLAWGPRQTGGTELIAAFLSELRNHLKTFPELKPILLQSTTLRESRQILTEQTGRLKRLQAGSPDFLALESALSDAALYIHLLSHKAFTARHA